MFTPDSPSAEGHENRRISLRGYTFDVEPCDDPMLFAVQRIVDERGYEVSSHAVPIEIRRELTRLMRGTYRTNVPSAAPGTDGSADFTSDTSIAA